ncbi:hypothetical protein CYLTODRAFT_458464 [Cylindrobasidium torrendii FP15055 ss-10]|uniref:DUF6532 domain-containing protein n=1 Tax=Cylindrobasidium torrendii FP15055 ss-10 TaxID=1314674 RepID=A0A0D7AXS7_9AGAR|nr:hypothetical protein CYLTODRAFT_458464 [Cylindrobasidium torrendii FP15055 ss-10]
MPSPLSTPTTASTNRVTRRGLIARRPGAVTRSASKPPASKATVVAPATPDPTPARASKQRRKDVELPSQALRKNQGAANDEAVQPSAPSTSQPTVIDDNDELAALAPSFAQQSIAIAEQRKRFEQEEKRRRAEQGSSDDEESRSEPDDEEMGAFDEDFDLDEDNGPEITDVTPPMKVQNSRKRKADNEIEVDDTIRVPCRKSSKVTAAEFTTHERGLLNRSKNISRAELLNDDAYLNPYNMEDRISNTIHRTAHDSRYACPEFVNAWARLRNSPRLSRAITYIDYTNQACRATTVCFVRGSIHLMGIPRAAPNAQEAERVTTEDVHWIKTNRVWQYGSIDLVNRTYDVLQFGQAEWVVDVACSLLITQRSRLDVDAFAWVMEAQKIPLSLIGLILTCGNHVVDEYASGRWERKPFTVASATTYTEVMFKLRSYELDYPDLVHEWQVKVFQQACERARKGWLVRTEVAEDGEAVKMMMQAAQADAARRAGKS